LPEIDEMTMYVILTVLTVVLSIMFAALIVIHPSYASEEKIRLSDDFTLLKHNNNGTATVLYKMTPIAEFDNETEALEVFRH
jgi:hypothetical protein